VGHVVDVMTELHPQQAASATDRISVFTNLWNAHYQDLWRFCLRRCASPELAEEPLHESFTVAWKRIDDMPDGAQARRRQPGERRSSIRSPAAVPGRRIRRQLIVARSELHTLPMSARELHTLPMSARELHTLPMSARELHTLREAWDNRGMSFSSTWQDDAMRVTS